jgi:hypothetical protein
MAELATAQPESLTAKRRALGKQIAALIEAFEAENPELVVESVDVSRVGYYVNLREPARVDVELKVR